MASDVSLEREIDRRRTFAIISHPDAGKTTMTEKLLLYGGAIRLAGSVKSRKSARHATSDWMEIEKQRGISVTSSSMQFEYGGRCVNILDTPGHQDFSEDTYRTLMAADSAVMLIDGAKGVERQTVKLFHVCRMRGIPIFTFVNKLDRAIKDPFELMEEIEGVLGIRSCPMNWPIGVDGDFIGVYDRSMSAVELFGGGKHGQAIVEATRFGFGGASALSREENALLGALGEYRFNRLVDEISLLDGAGDSFDRGRMLAGELTPMYFGSAMTNFGVEPFLRDFLELAPPPSPKQTESGQGVDPSNPGFTGFVFKIQANMNPAHRDRLAFIRVCSGRFRKNMEAYCSSGQGAQKKLRLSMPQQFMAQEREIIEEAYPGDIVGIFDPGAFRIGDTLSELDPSVRFAPIPTFPPEMFWRVAPSDSMKRKQFAKGVEQLAEEGAIQAFRMPGAGYESVVIGAVGALQIEVLEHRLLSEYGVSLRIQAMPHRIARWASEGYDESAPPSLASSTLVVRDRRGAAVMLFENEWSLRWAEEKNKHLILSESG